MSHANYSPSTVVTVDGGSPPTQQLLPAAGRCSSAPLPQFSDDSLPLNGSRGSGIDEAPTNRLLLVPPRYLLTDGLAGGASQSHQQLMAGRQANPDISLFKRFKVRGQQEDSCGERRFSAGERSGPLFHVRVFYSLFAFMKYYNFKR